LRGNAFFSALFLEAEKLGQFRGVNWREKNAFMKVIL